MYDAPPLDEFLPAWALWWPLFVVPAVTLVAVYLSMRMALAVSIGPRPLPEAERWWEQARRQSQLRGAALASFVLVIAITAATSALADNPLSSVSPTMRFALWFVTACVAWTVACARHGQRLSPRHVGLAQVSQDALVTATIFGVTFYLIAVAVGLLMPAEYNVKAIVLQAMFVLFAFKIGATGHLALLKRWGKLTPAGPRVQTIVDELAPNQNLTAYELHVSYANAFALLSFRGVAVTSRLLETFNDDDLRAVVAHEIAHLNDPHLARLLKLGWFYFAAVMLLIQIRPASATFGSGAMAGILGAAVAMLLAASFVARRILRKAERHADAEAARETDGPAYARALEKLYRDGLLDVSQKSLLGHPALYDRMIAAGVTPAYPRPRKASRGRVIVAAVAATATCVALVVAADMALRRLVIEPLAASIADQPLAKLTKIAAAGGYDYEALGAASRLISAGRRDVALAVVARCAERADEHPHNWSQIAVLLAELDRFDDADAALAKAREAATSRDVLDTLLADAVATPETAGVDYYLDIEEYIDARRAGEPVEPYHQWLFDWEE